MTFNTPSRQYEYLVMLFSLTNTPVAFKALNNDTNTCVFAYLKKCEFHVTSTSFLGFIFSAGSMQMDLEEIKAVKEWPHPEAYKQLQLFLCSLIPTKKFIRGYSSMPSPLP